MQRNPCLMSKAANAIKAEMKLNFSLIKSLLSTVPPTFMTSAQRKPRIQEADHDVPSP